MNTVAATAFDAPPATSAAAGGPCFHCGLPVAPSTTFGVLWNGKHQAMCCVGCEAVAAMIIDSGLDDFYRHRRGYSTQPEEMPPALATAAPAAAKPDTHTQTRAPVALYLRNLTCAACVWLAEKTLNRMAGVRDVRVNFTTHSVRLQADHPDADVFIDALRRVGLQAERIDDTSRDDRRLRGRRRQLVHFGVAGLSMMQVMMLTVPLYFASVDDIAPDARQLMGWAAWLMTVPALLFSARPIFVAAWRGLASKHIGMDLPVAVALLLTFAASTWALLTQHGHLYFDAITMFIFLLLGARWIESAARDRTAGRIERMANPQPVAVSRLPDFPHSESHERVNSRMLCRHDVIAVEQGAIIPADGVVLRGTTEVDEALMTGESTSVIKRVGDAVTGGTLNTLGAIVVRVTAVGESSVLAQLARLVESGLMTRPAFHGIADKVARYLAPATLLLALCGALIWAVIDPGKSLAVAVAILAITCPCAFALAAPTAAAAALGAMAERGLLVVRGHVLETLATATDVVFDKTGTITTGTWQLEDVICAPSARAACLAICGALESGAIHPVARAIQRALDQPIEPAPPSGLVADSISHVAGAGVEGVVNSQRYRFGSAAFAGVAADAAANVPACAKPVAVLAVDRDAVWVHLATLVFSDAVRPHAADTIAGLTAAGLVVHLLSGDQPAVVAAVARECGFDMAQVRAAQSAEDKRNYIAALQARGRTVVAIGDGMNDAPMLAAADAGIGLASGAAMTRLSSDAVADDGKQQLFACISDAFVRARAATAITRQNLGWAFAYNVIALPLAFFGLVTPLVAAAGMAVSSLVVVANASRLWSWNRSGF